MTPTTERVADSTPDVRPDAIEPGGPDPQVASPTGAGRRFIEFLTASAVTAVVLASIFHVETRAADFDPQYARNIVERTGRFGGSFYVNGIHNKGPLEPALYSIVSRLTSYDGFWFGIAVFVMVASTLAALAARRIVTLFGGPSWLGWGAFSAVYIHLTLSGADYAGVLYSRNMTVSLLSIALLSIATTTSDHSARRRIALLCLAGASIGLAVQTLQTAALTGLVLVGFALAGRQAGSPRTARERWWFLGSGAAAFVSAPVYYAAFGPWTDFWNGWWVYGRYMSAATDRGLRSQLGLGWHEFYGWSNSHAPTVIAIALFVLIGIARWRQLATSARALHVLLPAWWVAAWFEIILTQRYSSHYFVVTAFPAALMIAGLAWHVTDLLMRSGARVPAPRSVPAAAIVAAIVATSFTWSGTGPLVDGLTGASRFEGVAALARDRAQGRGGDTRSVQALLDLVSEPADPLLAWTNEPWPYLEFHRVSATRFIWKSFLVGEVYLGRTSAEFVLPGSWENWQSDVEATRPMAFLVDRDVPVPGDTPAGVLLADEFEVALETPSQTLALRPDVLRQLADTPANSTPWQLDGTVQADGSGWSFERGEVEFESLDGDPNTLRASLGDMRCRRWDATIEQGGLSFHFDDSTGASESLSISLDGRAAVSRSPNVDFLRVEVEPGRQRVAMIAGTSSAALLVDGVVVGALSLVSARQMSIAALDERAVLSAASTSAAPTLGECAVDRFDR